MPPTDPTGRSATPRRAGAKAKIGKPRPDARPVRSDEELKQSAVPLYDCGFSASAIAKALGTSDKRVRSLLVTAGVVIRPVGAVQQLDRAKIDSLHDESTAAIARRLYDERTDAQTYWRPWDPPTGQDSWREVLLTALEGEPTVSVSATAIRHLGRGPTRIELEAARRAAKRLESEGVVDLHRERMTGSPRLHWVLRRTGADPSIQSAGDAASGAAPAATLDSIRSGQLLIRRLRSLEQAAKRLETVGLDRDTRRDLVSCIDDTRRELATVRRSLSPKRRPTPSLKSGAEG